MAEPNGASTKRNDSPFNSPADEEYATSKRAQPGFSSKVKWALIALAAAVVIVLVVVLPVYFKVIRPRESNNGGSGSTAHPSPGSIPNPESPTGAITGGDGSRVIMENGTEFTYNNKFGGHWVNDPADPFNNGARAQSWSPALNETFRFGNDLIRGVNLGGWLVTEPFIVPSLYEQYADVVPPVVDEWTLCQAMIADTARGGLSQLEEHYKTFITEKDFADIAGAGLNFIRLPIGFWAISTWDGEPYLEGVSWKYALKAFTWARRYGLRVNLDLHALPGSQNAWNHSGKLGIVNFLNGVMGYANAQRTLEYIRIITEFISQPEWRDVVVMFGIVNEPLIGTIGREIVENFYYQVHELIRGITGVGEGNGPWISYHDGFTDTASWANFLPGADRIAMDTHPYFAFDGTGGGTVASYITRPCTGWGSTINTTLQTFGLVTAGEFSNGINDCGLFLTGVGGTQNFAGDCSEWTVWENWSQTTKDGLRQYALASMDSLQNWFFWTWKIGDSLAAGSPRSPLWAYKLGLDNGWMPTDPREAVGACASLGVAPVNPFDGTFAQPWMTGGPGAGTIDPATAALYPWPPASLSNAPGPASLLPSYTATAPIITAPPPTFTVPNSQATIDAGDGWYNSEDTTPGLTTIAGCTYPDAYSAVGIAVPTACTGAAAKKREAVPAPHITPAPRT